MNLLLIEQEDLTRELLKHLLVESLPGIEVTVAAGVQAAGALPVMAYEAIVLGMDSIQGMESLLSTWNRHDVTLTIQMSARLNEPGAGIRISTLTRSKHLIWESDQQSTLWPTYLVERVQAHFAALEIKQRVAALYSDREQRTTAELHWIFRAVDTYRQFIEVAEALPSWLPPAEIRELMDRPKFLGEYRGIFRIQIPAGHDSTQNTIQKTSRVLAEELYAAYECMLNLGRIAPDPASIEVWLLPLGQQIKKVNFSIPFMYYRDKFHLVFPVKYAVPVEAENVRGNVRFLLACLFNRIEKPNFSSDWDWFDQAISHWFAAREDESYYLGLPTMGLGEPFYKMQNIRDGVRFVRSLEAQLGARSVFDLWRSPEQSPMHAFAKQELVDRYFEWLTRAEWDFLEADANPAPTHKSHKDLNDCCCNIWFIPDNADYIRFNPSCGIRLKARLLRRFDLETSVAAPIPSTKPVYLPELLEMEERLLMVTNVFNRNRPAKRVHLRYDLEISR